MKKRILCLWMAGMLLLLAGCSSITPLDQFVDPETAEKIQEPPLPEIIPDGDLVMKRKETFLLYLPSRENGELIPQTVEIPGETTEKTAENLARSLLSYEDNDEVISLCGNAAVTLYGENPVELSGGVCTVNLSSSVLLLDYVEIFTLAQAMARTLAETGEIRFVNLLAGDLAIGLDITGNLPLGTVPVRQEESLAALWEKKMNEKTPLGGDLARSPVHAEATLYFPTRDGLGVLAESRMLTFPGQTPQQMASVLLEALSEGSVRMNLVPEMPDLSALQAHPPLVSELADGGRLITMTFRAEFRQALETAGVDEGNMLAAITETLSSFIPGIAALSIRVDGSQITGIETRNGKHIAFMGGLQKRRQFAGWLASVMTLYFEKDGVLCPCERAMERERIGNLRECLNALMAGPSAEEAERGFRAVLPEGLTEEDILGIAVTDERVCLNLSEHFLERLKSLESGREWLACYSMVEMLCGEAERDQITFLFEGEPVGTAAGSLNWKGDFLRNAALIQKKP